MTTSTAPLCAKCNRPKGDHPPDQQCSEFIPLHETAGELLENKPATPCQFCFRAIKFGMTRPGKRGGKPKPAPFDAVPPYRNHWITCPKSGEARAKFGRRRG